MISIFKNLSPGQILVIGYSTVILVGTILLLLPVSTVEGQTTNFLEALFTATSATAVTGLIVVNTAEHWTGFGQTVIMLLIQVGGLGFMTTTTLLFLILRRKVLLQERLIVMEEINYNKLSGVIRLTRYIILLTFITEITGTLLLYLYFKGLMPDNRAWFYALFHSISAFNNAGFDLFGNSLENFTGSLYINLIITFLFIFGGLGFLVISEIYNKRQYKKLSLHSKMVISMTLFLIISGTLALFILEFNNPATLGNYTPGIKLLASYFQAVTPRTAGFNTIPINQFRDVSLFIMIVLMFIGASPGSTGGGVKTTTAGTLLVVVYNMARGKEDIEIFRRRIKKKDIYKTLSVVVISLLIIVVVTIVLSITEEFAFIQIVFEVFSAFGTVGLTTGITPQLSNTGRLFIIITMFIGRVGPFTIAMALGRKRIKAIRYPQEDILIG
ncbi:TrkH family potassium uptake protein [Halothermothrix orenii]|uniref:Potassium uptake protein, TrkH family n=1 Tax=Halothermothrix orenii (strain H 168 / OCM 544 / DSM 9562) TaxID=373903 RepID=B8CXA1_HALOH|nr:TrkH family potassium uptake protein [Halothermothrix orenii]ACL69920.1 potassium uptake protein, TrkH family [Halothermothrix orenii H 168]